MATSHYEEATELLAQLNAETTSPSGDNQIKAQAAIANAILALAKEISEIKTDLRQQPKQGPFA